MKIDFRDLEILQAIKLQGTFAKAAEYLHRTPSAVTQRIQKLEHILGFEVFDRSGYLLTFTQEGQLLLERGHHILKQMERLESDLHLASKGQELEFSIAYDDLLSCEGVFTLIKELQKTFPNVSIKITREVLNGCWDALLRNQATIALGASGEAPTTLPCSQKNLGTVGFVFAIAPHHPLAQSRDPLTLDDLVLAYSIVISDTSMNLTTRSSSGTYPGQSIIVVPNMDAKILAQMQGLGVGYLPRHRIRHLLKNGMLVERQVERLKTKAQLKVAWRTDSNSKILAWLLEKLDKQEVRNILMGRL